MKKVLLAILTLAMMLCAFGISASATEANETQDTEVMILSETQTPDDSGSCGDNVTWEYYASTNTIVIKGQGDMSSANWTVPYTTITTAIIEPGVTSISPRAFYNCASLQSVTIPSGVTKIGTYAFYSCKKLTQIELPGTVETIERYAFSTCSKLEKVIFNEGLVTIGERAFYNCTALKSLDLPDTLVTIDRYAFNRCRAITNVTIPNNVKTIGLKAFYECTALESVYISKSVQTIGESAFTDCTELTTIIVDSENSYFCAVDDVLYNKDQTLLIAYPIAKTDSKFVMPDTVVEIANFAFYGCSEVDEITFSSVLKTIGEWTFAYCTSLESIEFPNSLESIDSWSFAYCTGISKMTLSDTMKVVGYGSFAHCTALESLHIPASVETIEEYIITDCAALESITVADENPNYSAQDNVMYNKDKTAILHYAQAKQDTEFTVPDTVKTVGKAAFEHSKNLKKIILQDGVEQILGDAFLECSALEEIVLPKSLTSVAEYAFQDCNVFKTICYDGDATTWKNISISKNGNNKFTAAKMLYAHIVTFIGDLDETQKVYTGRFIQPPVAEYGYGYEYSVDGQPWESVAITKDITLVAKRIELEVIRSSVYTIANGFIRKIEPGTTVGEFLTNVTPQGQVQVFKNDTASKPLGDSAKIGTGCLVKLYDADGNNTQVLNVVIMGDVSGDGGITTVDITLLKGNLSGTRELSAAQAEAANVVQPNRLIINTQDLTFLKGAISGTRTIQQA